jgi:hypothetical protein
LKLDKIQGTLHDPGLTPQDLNTNNSFKILELDKIQGTPDDPGLMPQALDTLFATIGPKMSDSVPVKPTGRKLFYQKAKHCRNSTAPV